MMTNTILKKTELRAIVKSQLAALTPHEKLDYSAAIWQRAELLPEFIAAQHVLLYWSMPSEVNSHAFAVKWAQTKHVYLPLVVENRLEVVRFFSRDQLVFNPSFGVSEVHGAGLLDLSVIDVAFVPGVAFDGEGHRLGRGGGFYDRLLPHLQCAVKVGVAFGCQLINKVAVEHHDVKMDMVLVPY
jgi:5-formyltetrahydrofolate cyclo-ligase